MLRLIISGCCGHMGRAVADVVAGDPDLVVAAGFDVVDCAPCGFPVYREPSGFPGRADVVVDFSSPAALDALLSYCVGGNIPLVLCATGYSAGQLASIDAAAGRVPVFRSANMSIGINLLADLVRRACGALGAAFDVEIVERHHRRKVDAPSGTALLLADAAASALPYEPDYAFDRHSRREARKAEEIGISAVRGGTIVGDHEVIFAGRHEVIELRHSAASRDVFADGAVRAAKFIAGVKEPGLYDMTDVLAGM